MESFFKARVDVDCSKNTDIIAIKTSQVSFDATRCWYRSDLPPKERCKGKEGTEDEQPKRGP